jgi:hypothetical protein
MLRFVIPMVLAATVVAGCSSEDKGFRRVGTVLDPYCMPDGSIVRIQYPNSSGDFDGTKGDPKNCAWYKG